MANNVVYFAIHADDVERAKGFYHRVFNWGFEAWGPPGFFLIHTGTPDDPGIRGALQQREEPLDGQGMRGYECTISVASVEETAKAIEEHGGRIVLPPTKLPTVGTLIKFEDTERNLVGAMKYEQPPRFAGR